MITINSNVYTGRNYDASGNLFEDGLPRIPFGNTDKVLWQLYTATSGAVSAWTKLSLSGSGYTALCSCDNNFTHKIKGTLLAAKSGAVTAIDIALEAEIYDISPIGTIALFDSNGDPEYVGYSAVSEISGGYRFTVSETLTGTYAIGAEADAPEQLYFSAAINGEESDPATGLFVFYAKADSAKLRNAVDYENLNEAPDVVGLELLVKQVDGDVETDLYRMLVPTFSIPSGIAAMNQNEQPTPTINATMAAIANALFALGFDTEFSVSGASWHTTQTATDNYLRARLKTSTGDWMTLFLPRGGGIAVASWGPLSARPSSGGTSATSYYATDTGLIYLWKPGSPGSWSDGISPAATFEIVSVTTGEPGTDVIIEETAESTSNNRKYNVTIPKGVTGDTGPDIDRNPIMSAGVVADSTYNARIVWLDSTYTTMAFYDVQSDVSKVKIYVISSNPAVTGNIILIPVIDGVDQSPITVAVGATLAAVDLAISFTGVHSLGIRRDTGAVADTLDATTAKIPIWMVYHA